MHFQIPIWLVILVCKEPLQLHSQFLKKQILSYVFFLLQTWVIFPCVIHRHWVLLKGYHYDLLTRGSHYQKVFIGCKHKLMSGEGREILLHFFYVDWWSYGFCFCLNKKIYIFNVVHPKQENNVEANQLVAVNVWRYMYQY